MANETQEFIDGLNEMFASLGIQKRIPSIEEIKRQNAAKNARSLSRNQQVCQNAIGKELRVQVGKNEFLRGVIVEAELSDFGTAKITLECGVAKVRRGPFYVSQLPR